MNELGGVNKAGHCRWCGRKLGWAPDAKVSRYIQDILDNPAKHTPRRVEWAVVEKGAALQARAKESKGYNGQGFFCTSKCSELFGGFFVRSGYRIVHTGVFDGEDTWEIRVERASTSVVPMLMDWEREGKIGS